ncbi:hypothetical protein [Paracoccus luteus]|uniref:hypothetical protein n=1 Tax=Paracoccus luteus TaxID=2508543 RepID=UPI00106F0FE2|nr:hypothetical protein [Paracoccus luteus]
MTKPTGGAELATAYAALDPLCAKVGLVRATLLPQIDGAAAAPDGIALWSSPYAQLLLWPCSANDAATFETAAHTAQRWFDEVLIAGERQAGGRPIDGYLVLALPMMPEEEAREDVRRLELSAQVCRKHLIWPSTPDDPDHATVPWRRVADITVVGLPEAELLPGAELQWPAIDAEAKALWEELDAIGVSAVLLNDGAA